MGLKTRQIQSRSKAWLELSGAKDQDIVQWAQLQEWARAMAGCQQDSHWHAEGDVWTHTLMVCRQLPGVPGWGELDRASQVMLLLAAIFHDSGKPATTAPDPITGRLRAPKHALVGAQLARQILATLHCDLATREHIVHLVRYHSRPAFLAEQHAFDRPVIHTSWLVRNRLLHMLAIADTQGRTTKPESETSDVVAADRRANDRMELWRLACEEQNCLDHPYPFVNDHARFLFYRDALSSLHYTPHEEYRCKVTMMSGLPGSGKDTWLATQRPQLPVVSLDDIREELDVKPTDGQGQVAHLAKDRVKQRLRDRQDFAFNATNISTQNRKRWIDLFADYGARVELVYLEPPLNETLARNAQRERPVPERVIRDMAMKLETPSITEAHELIVSV